MVDKVTLTIISLLLIVMMGLIVGILKKLEEMSSEVIRLGKNQDLFYENLMKDRLDRSGTIKKTKNKHKF